MATEFSFYQLLRTPLEAALPRLLEKVQTLGLRAVVVAGSEERVRTLDTALWTYDPASFLAHGTAADGIAQEQPVWLTHRDENPNGAAVLVLTDGAAVAHPEAYERCLDIFDGRDEEAVAEARERYRRIKRAGYPIRYFRQTDTGWQLAASVENAPGTA